MTKENYLEFLKSTIEGTTSKNLKYLKSKMIESNIVYEGSTQLSLDMKDAINITELDLKSQILTPLLKNEEVIKIIENWEFIKEYKYSVLFETNNFKNVLNKLEELNEKVNEGNEFIKEGFGKPSKKDCGNVVLLKFNIALSGYNQLGEELLQKYPFIVVVYKNYGLIEFRFDTIARHYQNERISYSSFIQQIRLKFKDIFAEELIPLELDFLISKSKDNTDDNLKVTSQAMNLSNGSSVQLDVGDNDEYVLPFIGELRNLMNEYQKELENCPKLKDALEEYLFEKEEMSEYPWIELMWEDEIKTRSKRIKIVFKYKKMDYSLIQHYSNNTFCGMERMEYVTKYINENRRSS